VETRVRQGAELRELMREVSKLKSAGKMEAAREQLAAAAGNAAGPKTIQNRAGEVADVLFKAGGLDTTRAVLDRLLDR